MNAECRGKGKFGQGGVETNSPPSQPCLVVSDFPTGVLLLHWKKTGSWEAARGMFIFVFVATPEPTTTELPGRDANLRHKG